MADDKSNTFLLRLRNQDTPTGVTRATIDLLMEQTGLTRTEIAHLALRQFADKYLPKYQADDGPLSEPQLAAIRAASTASDVPEDRFTDRLF